MTKLWYGHMYNQEYRCGDQDTSNYQHVQRRQELVQTEAAQPQLKDYLGHLEQPTLMLIFDTGTSGLYLLRFLIFESFDTHGFKKC